MYVENLVDYYLHLYELYMPHIFQIKINLLKKIVCGKKIEVHISKYDDDKAWK
jgi:hypothetical protein